MPNTVGELKAILRDVPDDTPLVNYSESMDSEVDGSATFYPNRMDFDGLNADPVFVLWSEY